LLAFGICVALERPQQAPDETSPTICANIEFITQIFFGVDVVLKMFGYGPIKTQWSYFRRSYWHVFDFIVFACTFLSSVVTYFHLPLANALKVFEVGRAARPLRLICFSEGMHAIAST